MCGGLGPGECSGLSPGDETEALSSGSRDWWFPWRAGLGDGFQHKHLVVK